MISGMKFQFVAVYAYNTADLRKPLWNEMKQIAQQSQLLLFCGDFNTVLSSTDRLQGNAVTDADCRDFRKCMGESELNLVRAVGNNYSWSNNQSGKDRIYSMIDRALGNESWFRNYPHVVVELREIWISDHCPQLLDLGGDNLRRNIPFRIFNVLLDHAKFPAILSKYWGKKYHTNRLFDVWYKLKNLKYPLKELNCTQFHGIEDKLQMARDNLRTTQQLLAQDHLNEQLIGTEKKWLSDIEKWSMLKEKVWQQKSRVLAQIRGCL